MPPILAIIAIAAVLGILWLRTPLPAPRILATRQITHDSSQKFQLMTDGSRSQLVPVLDGISADNVEFSRDGLWVTYVLEPEGTLWRSRADGSDRLQLTHSPMQAALAHWSDPLSYWASPNSCSEPNFVTTTAGFP